MAVIDLAKVKLRNALMTALGAFSPGAVVTVDERTGEAWVKAGLAEWVEKPHETKVVEPKEHKPRRR